MVPPPDLSDDEYTAMLVWSEMGHRLDWQALPWLIVRHGIRDSEELVDRLLVIRNTRPSSQ